MEEIELYYQRDEFQQLGGRLSKIEQDLKASRDSQVPLNENLNNIVGELTKLGKEVQKLAQERENTESELKRKEDDIQLVSGIQKDLAHSVEKCEALREKRQLLQEITNDKKTDVKRLEEELKQNKHEIESVQQKAQSMKENLFTLQAELEEKHENVMKFLKEKGELTKSYIIEKEKAKQLVQITLSDRNEMEV